MDNKKRECYDVVVIGGGPAGMTAALYAGRARLKTLLLEKSLMGGMATYTSEIENYPGFPEPLDGVEMMKRFDKQLRRFGVDVKLTDVRSVDFSSEQKIVSTFRTDYAAKTVIIATGNKPRLTGARDEERFLNDKGISFCATCDASRNTGKRILVIGSGDAAIEEGCFLTKFAREVVISVLHDEGVMDANKVAQEMALANPKISFIWNTMVEAFEGGEREDGEGGDALKRVVLKHLKTGELIPVEADTCFLFIGYTPNTRIFEGVVSMTRRGFIKTNENMETSVSGVFAVGDCRDKLLRQVATAVGDGAVAGFMAEKYVEEVDYVQHEILEAQGLVMIFVYNAVDAADREWIARIEQIQQAHKAQVDVRWVDVYKTDRIARRLGYTRSPSLIFMKEGRVLENITDLAGLEEKVVAWIEKSA